MKVDLRQINDSDLWGMFAKHSSICKLLSNELQNRERFGFKKSLSKRQNRHSLEVEN